MVQLWRTLIKLIQNLNFSSALEQPGAEGKAGSELMLLLSYHFITLTLRGQIFAGQAKFALYMSTAGSCLSAKTYYKSSQRPSILQVAKHFNLAKNDDDCEDSIIINNLFLYVIWNSLKVRRNDEDSQELILIGTGRMCLLREDN